jgi:hypothetical protein
MNVPPRFTSVATAGDSGSVKADPAISAAAANNQRARCGARETLFVVCFMVSSLAARGAAF